MSPRLCWHQPVTVAAALAAAETVAGCTIATCHMWVYTALKALMVEPTGQACKPHAKGLSHAAETVHAYEVMPASCRSSCHLHMRRRRRRLIDCDKLLHDDKRRRRRRLVHCDHLLDHNRLLLLDDRLLHGDDNRVRRVLHHCNGLQHGAVCMRHCARDSRACHPPKQRACCTCACSGSCGMSLRRHSLPGGPCLKDLAAA